MTSTVAELESGGSEVLTRHSNTTTLGGPGTVRQYRRPYLILSATGEVPGL